MTRTEIGKKWNHLVARAWSDDDLRSRLLRDPVPVLKENGIDLPQGVHVNVHENSSHAIHLVMPTKPPSEVAEIARDDTADTTYFYTIF